MDYQSIIIGLVCLALFVVPIFFLQRKKNQRFLQDFMDHAGKHQMAISQYEFWDPCFAIGIDQSQKKLLYTKKYAEHFDQVVIDLTKVEKCTVSSASRDINGNKVIDSIELRFVYQKVLALPTTTLEFYNKEESLNLNEELLLARKWHEIVSSSMGVPAHEAVVELT